MRFISLKKYKFILEPWYYFYGWSKSPEVVARASALKALLKARRLLPKGYNFKVWDAQRPRTVQLAMLNSFRRRFRSQFPKLSKNKLEEMVFTFGARPLKKVTRLDTHRNGGSFDLTIVDRQGQELYMGTEHDDLTADAATEYFEKIKRLSPRQSEARKNRRLLIRVMRKAHFINYSPEWWHWSFEK